jgi:cytochrome c-type biogenesis protein CcmH/NrfG
MKLDGFDLLLLGAVVLLGGSALFQGLNVRNSEAARQIRAVQPDETYRQGLTEARNLLASGRVEEATTHLANLESGNPAVAETHLLLGQAFLEARDYPSSLREYRTALVLDADYADEHSGKFAGKRIKAAVRAGLDHLHAELRKAPGNPAAQEALKDAFYLERMLAGGCG